MKDILNKLVLSALQDLLDERKLELEDYPINIRETKDKVHGDFSSNIALIIAKSLGLNSLDVAEAIASKIKISKEIKKIEVAAPGFINFFVKQTTHSEILDEIYAKKDKYGAVPNKKKLKVLIEYVSSNPTGPLHIGHGRGAIFGSVLANLLSFVGFKVDEEYYINDQGRQLDVLTLSVWLRYLIRHGIKIGMAKGTYQGVYVVEIAKYLDEKRIDAVPSSKEIITLEEEIKISIDEPGLDRLIALSKDLLGNKFKKIKTLALNAVMEGIKEDLKSCGVHHNKWFNETSLYKKNKNKNALVLDAINLLTSENLTYKKDAALWFKSTTFGDDKDRVLQRANGEYTYFASDIAYHKDKYNRDYDKIINVWGSDHHGYLPRVKAAISGMGLDIEKLEVSFIQFANLIRKGEKVSMSTRTGDFVTLSELIREASSDATRFFFINRKADQHLDFDLDLAKDQSKDNPLFYIQYAHARICSISKNSRSIDKNILDFSDINLSLLSQDKEIEIMKSLKQFPEVIRRSANSYEPHLLCYYLKDLAGLFHSYYNDEKILVDKDKDKTKSRLYLLESIKQVICNGLTILSIQAPESM